ncbi:MAG: phosphatidate cytidylyltransferase, partial [Phycisphaeraceae bacterium]
AALLALIYLGTLPGFLLAIRRWHSAWVVVGIVLVIKASDIGAYFVGRAIGRHKLIPWLSPGKTWEGLAGGVAMSALVAVGLVALSNELGVSGRYVYDENLTSRRFAALDYPLWLAAIAGGLLALAGVLGDLTASLFKRDAGLKDSGKSIPGFGGVLDVIDSLVLAAPVAYWMVRLMHAVG